MKPECFPIDLAPYRYINLLSDEHGIFGISVASDMRDPERESEPRSMITRADRVAMLNEHSRFEWSPDLFQGLARRRAPWECASAESMMASLLTRSWLIDGGLTPKEFGANRAVYWAAKHRARRTISKVARELLRITVGDDRVALLRRYPIRLRASIFSFACQHGDYAWQLAETFPELARRLATSRWFSETKYQDAVEAMKAGRPLREVAAFAEVPMALRMLPPQLVRYSEGTGFDQLVRCEGAGLVPPEVLLHHAPITVPRLRKWLGAITIAARADDPDFTVWVAKNFDRLGSWRVVPGIVQDLTDWVRASDLDRDFDAMSKVDPDSLQRVLRRLEHSGMLRIKKYPDLDKARPVFAGRRFNPKMAPQTALKLSDEWHELAATLDVDASPFPEPWYPGGQHGTVRIEPIDCTVTLARCARALRNCAATYAPEIAEGYCFLYRVTKGDELVAMLELRRLHNGMPAIAQLKGPCNAKVTSQITRSANQWLRMMRENHGVGKLAVKRLPPPETLPWEDPFEIEEVQF